MKEGSDGGISASQMLTLSSFYTSTLSEFKPCNRLAGGPRPSYNHRPVSRQDPHHSPLLPNVLTFLPTSFERKREQWAKDSLDPSRGLGEEAWRPSPVPWQLTSHKRPHARLLCGFFIWSCLVSVNANVLGFVFPFFGNGWKLGYTTTLSIWTSQIRYLDQGLSALHALIGFVKLMKSRCGNVKWRLFKWL